MIRSLRTRLLLGTLAASLGVFLVAAGALYWRIDRALLEEFDATLAARGAALAALTEQGADGFKTDMDPGSLRGYGAGRHPDFFILYAPDGTVAAQSASLAGRPTEGLGGRTGDAMGLSFVTMPNGRPGRRLAMAFVPHAEDGAGSARDGAAPRAFLVIERDAVELREKSGRLAGLLAGVFALVAMTSGLALWWIVGRGLLPLRRLAEEIQTLDDRRLSARIGMEGAPLELDPVVAQLNALLGKLEDAFVRERAFSADVAHELRTPLAAMTTTLQVCAVRRRGVEEHERTVATCLGLAGDMRAMVEKLLLMAGLESGNRAVASEAVDFRSMMEQAWKSAQDRAAARGLRVEWEFPAPLPVWTDGELAGIVVRNLMDNALAHADEGGALRLAGTMEDGQVVLRLANSGSQVRAADAEKVFDRFWRADGARTSDGGHCGLGLPLCRRIMDALGGTIRVDAGLGGWFAVELRLPALETVAA